MTIFEYTLSSLSYLTDDIVLLHFSPSPTSALLTYETGQYIEALTKNGPFLLSIANTPLQENKSHTITFHLRVGAQHPPAVAFLNQVTEDKMIRFTGPKGHCIVKPADYYYFIAGGTGFSPIQGLLTDILPMGKPCVLYWGIREPKDLYQQKLIATWQKKYPHFSYIPVLSQPDINWPGKTGWVHQIFFTEQTDTLKKQTHTDQPYLVYASGPYPMIQALKNGFIERQLELDKLLSDMLPH
jgi:CDP-4-dehydro-6-deoxyglucose reductase